MPESKDKSRLEQIVELFTSHNVRFIVIGGQAEYLFGSPRVTYDIDLCYERSAQNLENLAAALSELKPTLRGAPPDLPFVLDAKSLALGSNFTFNTALGPLDLLGWVEPLGDYGAVAKHDTTIDLQGLKLLVISLDDLIRIKEYIRRPKDRESLMQLQAIKRLRDTQR
jgi:hypothetical protein